MKKVICDYLRGLYRLWLLRMKTPFAHQCMFRKEDVLNLDIQPKCMICGKGLEEI